MSRSLRAVCVVALLGLAVVVSVPLRFYARLHAAEAAAATALARLADAQRAFRTKTGRLGYATELASLTTACPGEVQAIVAASDIASEYTLRVRAAAASRITGSDCHGRPVASDFYAAAEPPAQFGGAQAFALTSRGRIYLFFDGIAPRESDMGLGGLAVPLDRVETFRIP